MAISKVAGHPPLIWPLRPEISPPDQLLSIRVSAPNEETAFRAKAACFPVLSRGLVDKDAFSHLKVLLAGSTGVLCTAGPRPQMVEAICFVN